MRIRDLECFEVLAEELHFGRAAARLHMQQPPLSRLIRALEDDLGVQLFRRDNRHVVLTAEGEWFAGEARVILHRMDGARTMLQAMGDGTAGVLRVGFIDSACTPGFAAAIRGFRQRYPAVHIVLEEMSSFDQVQGLDAHTLHVGFVHSGLANPEHLARRHVLDEPYQVAVAADHSWAQGQSVCVAQLAEEPIIFSGTTSVRQYLTDRFAAFGLRPLFGIQARMDQTAERLAACGEGWTLLPAHACTPPPPGLACLPVQEPLMRLTVDMVWNPRWFPPLVRRFCEAMPHSL